MTKPGDLNVSISPVIEKWLQEGQSIKQSEFLTSNNPSSSCINTNIRMDEAKRLWPSSGRHGGSTGLNI
ncbi:hypothetical protein NC651_029607 [Populus alba x Populus x berolinensis]|nr:hypothetical protein NC651_029607 [Populus alba x Populus x berolinensis]